MEVKIDTKEKFTVVTPVVALISANIAAKLSETCSAFLDQPVKNIVLNLEPATEMEPGAASAIATLQQHFYENSASFVLCNLKEPVEAVFEKEELLNFMNITPTESEAWDIVQMEEIERELMDSSDVEFEDV
ncbi:MAG: STAS domain-containing protein [Bacteroidota bacterium]